jgi:hypothetical protein
MDIEIRKSYDITLPESLSGCERGRRGFFTKALLNY